MLKLYRNLKSTFAFVVSLFAFNNLYAQTPDFVTQPATLNPTSTNTVPYYYGGNGTRAQALYPASIFSNISEKKLITAVYMIPRVSGSWTYNNIEISIGQPNISSLATSAYVTGLKRVFTRTNFTFNRVADQWFRFELDSTFFFDPTLPLVVEINISNGSTGSWETHYNNPHIVGSFRNYSANYNATIPTGGGASIVNKLGLDLKSIAANNAGIKALVSPSTFCGFTSQDIKVRINNFGNNLLNNVVVKWSLDGIMQPSLNWNYPMDTVRGSLYPSDTVVTLGNSFFTNAPQTLKAWTELPNGVADTSNADDTITVTIYPSLNGTYTIGGTTPDFVNIGAAVNVLKTAGVCGPVIFNVSAGTPAYTSNVAFNNILGSSDVNTITFHGNGASITSAVNPVVAFTGSSYITLDSFNIEQTGTTGYAVHVGGASHHLTLTKNKIAASQTSTASTSGGIIVSGSQTAGTTAGNNGQYITVSNNEIIGGYYSLSFAGNSGYQQNYGHVITNNKLRNSYYYGVALANADTVTFSGNEIERSSRGTVSTTTYGIYLNGSRNVKVRKNRIHNMFGTTTHYGIYINSANAAGYETEISNNLIYNLGPTGSTYGIYCATANTGLKIFHNTFQHNVVSGSSVVRGIYFGVAPNNVEFRNNIISITGAGTGVKTGIYVAAISASFISDHNVIHINTTASNNIGYWTAARVTMADWRANSLQDALSLIDDPFFAGLANGNLTPLSGNIDNQGTPTAIADDILGTFRSTVSPDIGAYEFTGVAGDLALTGGKLTRSSSCYSGMDTLFVTIKNMIGTQVDFSISPIFVSWEVNGPAYSNGALLISSGILAPGASGTFYTNNVNRAAPGDYTFIAYLHTGGINGSSSNDTLYQGTVYKVEKILSVLNKNITVNAPATTVNIQAKSPMFPPGAFRFTEVRHTSSTAPVGGWPTYLGATVDYVEISGVPNSDLGGITLEQWNATALVSTFTFPAGTILSPNGTAIIAVGAVGTTQPSPANFYYHGHAGISTDFDSGTGYAGRILKDNTGTVIDAFIYSGSGSYTFPAASGVTASDWSGQMPASASTSGLRLIGADMNNSTNWIVANTSPNLQDPNTYNAGFPVITPNNLTGLTWYHNGSAISTNARATVGPYTVPGVYEYVAEYNTSCGVFYDTVFVTAGAGVPVKLTNFNAQASGDDAIVNWSTASEKNASHFEVYRSVDAKEWNVIAKVSANGNSNTLHNYRTIDKNVMSITNGSIHYKLKSVDRDGKYEWSKEVLINTNRNRGSVSVHPNPFNDKISVNLSSEAEVKVEIITIQGELLMNKAYQPKSSILVIDNMSSLTPGVYFIKVTQNGNSTVNKIVKQ